MFINNYTTSLKRKICFFFTSLFLLMCFATNSYGQGNFTSGSTGADGAFSPSTSQTLTLPPSGIFNFTTINIPSGVTVTFTKNASNTPVTMLATGDVVIAGTIDLSGQGAQGNGLGGRGGAGGFDGGNGGFAAPGLLNGLNGGGPGGGQGGRNLSGLAGFGGGAGYATTGSNGNAPFAATSPADGSGGSAYGNGLLIPLIGGSGGGGAASNNSGPAPSGGGGGGAILIASSTSITLANTSNITVSGGGHFVGSFAGGLAGSGGAIKLVANTISGNGVLRSEGGKNPSGFQNASPGFIRAEAFTLTSFNPNSIPAPLLGLPNPVNIPNAPQLRIVSVAGIAAPSTPVGSLSGAPDISLPSTQANPVTVVLEAVNVPSGAFADVKLTPSTGASTTVISSAFAPTGSPATTSATAQVNLSLGMSLITASLTVDLTQAKLEPFFIDGEQIDKIEVTAVFGEQSQTTYITSSGKRISR